MRRTGVVLDRFIRRGWLDAAADAAARELSGDAFRAEIDRFLADAVPSQGRNCARAKTKTVLAHIWSTVPAEAKDLRDDSFHFFTEATDAERLALHWGMCLATYPFFRDLAASIGRLLALQGMVTRSQVHRRAAEAYGERTTIARAVPTLIASLREWGVLTEKERGVLRPQRWHVANVNVQKWLLEAAIIARGNDSAQFGDLVKSPTLFPFELCLSPHDLHQHPRLDVLRLGLDQDVVTRRAKVPEVSQPVT